MTMPQPYSAFEDLYRPFGSLFNMNLPSALADRTHRVPAVDIRSSDEGFTLEMEVPGYKAEEVEVEAHDGVLTIKGEHDQEETSETDNVIRSERYHGAFCRKFTLPEGTDSDEITAEVKDGVLHVAIPHVSPAEPKKIDVS